MTEDRSLFGDGPYPVGGPLAVLARIAFLGAVAAIVVAVFLPARLVPDFVHSHYLQHFAAFYVAALFGLAAMVRSRTRAIASWCLAFATLLEASHLLAGAELRPLIRNWVADVGGLAAAFAPLIIERFRQRFARLRA
jgi:hypothetical protein